jgi:hypothetical protein
MQIVIPVRNDISVRWIRILGVVVAAGLVAAAVNLNSRAVVDMASAGVTAAVGAVVVTKDYKGTMLIKLIRTGRSKRKSGIGLDLADVRIFCKCVMPWQERMAVATEVVAPGLVDRLIDNE